MYAKCFTTFLLCLVLALAILAAACSPVHQRQPLLVEPGSLPVAPTATPLLEKEVEANPASPTPESQSTAEPEEAWQTITPPDESVTFELPASWRHHGQDTNWSPDEGKTLIGLRMGWNRPGSAIESGLLPEDARVLETQTEMISTGGETAISVRRFRIETRQQMAPLPAGQEPPLVYETHLLLVRPDTMVFDFMLRAPTEAEMDALYPLLLHAVESAVFP